MSKLEIISPDSSLRKQIESAIKPKITLTKKQKPKILPPTPNPQPPT
jgi:hypothetical protein